MIVNQLERLSSSFSLNKGTYDGMSRAPEEKAGFTSLADAVWTKQLVDDDQMLRNVEVRCCIVRGDRGERCD